MSPAVRLEDGAEQHAPSNRTAGDTLSASGWQGSTPMNITYTWTGCDQPGSGCTTLANTSSYTVQPSDQGTYITVTETATNALGTSTLTTSPAQVTTSAAAPSAYSAPTISGVPRDGQTLTASTGGWYNNPTSFTYQWSDCVVDGSGGCVPIAGATGATYQATSLDDSWGLQVTVTATNANGSASATSRGLAQVQGIPPTNVSLPSITGATVAGSDLTADPGQWTGNSYPGDNLPLYAYQWELCDGNGANCSVVTGPLSDLGQYTPTTAQLGDTLRVAVTTKSPAEETYEYPQYDIASATAVSPPTAPIGTPTAPTNLTAPTIQGTPQDGSVITVTNGTWSGSTTITYTYNWESCDADGNNCTALYPPGTIPQLQLTSQQVGQTLRGVVTATNAAGTAQAATDPFTVEPPPIPTLLPGGVTLSSVGSVLSPMYPIDTGWNIAASAAWNGDPTAYSYQWLDCDPTITDPNTNNPICLPIPGATAATYTTTATDVGYELAVTETASNQTGSSSATSTPIPVTTPLTQTGPTYLDDEEIGPGPPTYLGPAVVGAQITAQPLVSQAPSSQTAGTTYQFTLPDGTVLQNGSNPTLVIPQSALAQAITITESTVFLRSDGQPLNVPGYGTTVQLTATTATVALPPTPTISGNPIVGSTYTADAGNWPSAAGGAPLSYQWQDCNTDGQACTNIAYATSETYTPVPTDVGQMIRVVVTAGTAPNSYSMPSEPSATILSANAPQNTSAPTITGTPTALQTLTASTGDWSGDQPITYTYQWQSCDSQDANCTDIAGADSSTYVPADTDVGDELQVVVTAANGAGSITATSQPTTTIAPEPAPLNTQLPNLDVLGPNTDAATFSTDAGQWANLPADSVPADLLYQWQRCAQDGSQCSDIDGATAQDYDATAADDGSRIRVVVTGETDSGTASAASPLSAPVQPSQGTLTGKLIYDSGTGLYTANLDGTNQTKISDCTTLTLTAMGNNGPQSGSCSFNRPEISPNGQMVVVSVNDSIYTMNYDGTDPQQLGLAGRNPAWAPDGTAIVYTGPAVAGGYQPGTDDSVPNTQLYTAYLADPAATNSPLPMPDGVVSTDTGSYSPDGGSIAYGALPAGGTPWAVYIASSDGTNPTIVAAAQAWSRPPAPTFTPDSDSIIYTASSGQPDSVGFTFDAAYEQDIDPGAPTQISPIDVPDQDFSNIIITPDGHFILTKSDITIVFASGGGVFVEPSPETTCTITPPSQDCVPLPINNATDLSIGTTTKFGPKHPANCNPGSACGDLGLVRQFAPIEKINGDDGFLPISVNTLTSLQRVGAAGPSTPQLCTSASSAQSASYSCGALASPFHLPQGPSGTLSWLAYPGAPPDVQLTTSAAQNVYQETQAALQHANPSSPPDKVQQADQEYYYLILKSGNDTEIEYWFYYTFNYFAKNSVPCGVPEYLGRDKVTVGCSDASNDMHEGDWEHVNVFLVNGHLAGEHGENNTGDWLDSCADVEYYRHGLELLMGPTFSGADSGAGPPGACTASSPAPSAGEVGEGGPRLYWVASAMHGTHPYSFSAAGSHADYPYAARQDEDTYAPAANAVWNGGPDWFTCAGRNQAKTDLGVADPAIPALARDGAEAFGYVDYPCDLESWYASLGNRSSVPLDMTPARQGLYPEIQEGMPRNKQLANLAGTDVASDNNVGWRFACWDGRFGGEPHQVPVKVGPFTIAGVGQSPDSPLAQQGQVELKSAASKAVASICGGPVSSGF